MQFNTYTQFITKQGKTNAQPLNLKPVAKFAISQISSITKIITVTASRFNRFIETAKHHRKWKMEQVGAGATGNGK
jgi:hypothetical protein